MFNIDQLVSEEYYNFTRDIYPFSSSCHKGISCYDHFISPMGYEVIILPFYSSTKNIELLQHNNFIVVDRLNHINEKALFAFKLVDNTNMTAKKYKLTVMTLFYDETNEDLENFYNYYINQGVEHFFMYYNGRLDDRPNLIYNSNITYIEWNYCYWYLTKDTNQRIHHAQIPALLSFSKKYLPHTEYSLMIDTDEFLFVDQCTLKSYIMSQQNKKNLHTNHNWSHIDFKTGQVKYFTENQNRAKSILCSDACSIKFIPNVHIMQNSQPCDVQLFHNKKDLHNKLKKKETNNQLESLILPFPA